MADGALDMDALGGSPETGEPLGGEMGGADEPFEPKDEFEREAMDFMDEEMPMASRMMALREAIKLCTASDYGAKPGGAEKPPAGLALVFGGKEKKG